MNRLYKLLKEKSRGTRNRDVRIKLELFLLAIKLEDVQEACSRRGFSRTFYYKWWNRFKKAKFDLKSLEELSRRPNHSPKQISKDIEEQIRWYQLRDYGARMIWGFLMRSDVKISPSTVSHVLRKRKKSRPLRLRQRLKAHRKRYELPIPGQRIQMDVKYVPVPVGGAKAYSYVAIDECTRWRFARTYSTLDGGTTVLFVEQLKKACPFVIHTLQTDNGQEFTYKLNPVAQHLVHPLDQWCSENQIQHRLIPPGVKELNGKVERSHRIDEYYFYWKACNQSLRQFNESQRKWIKFYNEERPHGGLNFLTPLEKLAERMEALQIPIASPEQEHLAKMRLTFLEETPKRLNRADRKIDNLEKELFKLLKAA